VSAPNRKLAPSWQGKPIAAVLFDLDGTLLDTLDDIASALNGALADLQRRTLSTGEVRRLIGRGVPSLVARALTYFGEPAAPQVQAAVVERFCVHYGRLHARAEGTASVYPGVTAGLLALQAAGLRLAVVTNKRRHFARGLLERLGLSETVQVVVGGDTCQRRKPDPLPLRCACAALQIEPAQALMVGDSMIDVLAARAAGMSVICVPYGYNEGRGPESLACDALIPTIADLPALLISARR